MIKVIYNEKKAKETKEKLDAFFATEHKKQKRNYTIKTVVFGVFFLLGILFFIGDLWGKGPLISYWGDVIVMLIGVISAFIFVHFLVMYWGNESDYETNMGLYRYPASVVYMLVSAENQVLRFERDDTDEIGVLRLMKIVYRTPKGTTLHKSIEVVNRQYGMNGEEVLDLHAEALLIPHPSLDKPEFTVIEEFTLD